MNNFKTVLLLFIATFLFVNKGITQEEATPQETEATQEVQITLPDSAVSIKSLLWEISGKDLEKSSYLYGTIHLIDKKDYFLTDATKYAFDQSERVTFEINMKDMTNLGAQFSMMMKAFMKNGTTLRDLLNEEDYQLVKTHFDDMGLPLAFLERIKPMFLSALAAGDISPDAMGSGEVVSYEMEFMEMADDSKKEMGGLETAEYQMSMFDSIPYDAQAKMLVESIKAEDSGSGELEKMIELYKTQDIEGMQTMMGEDEEGIAKYEELLLINRNKNWIPIMEEMMKDKVTFFAVGAGHLGGKKGVIELLRTEGYVLKPLY